MEKTKNNNNTIIKGRKTFYTKRTESVEYACFQARLANFQSFKVRKV